MSTYRITLNCGVVVYVQAETGLVGRLTIEFAQSRRAEPGYRTTFNTADVQSVENLSLAEPFIFRAKVSA